MRDASDLRAEMFRHTRMEFAAFVMGTLMLCSAMKAMGHFQAQMVAAFGEIGSFWIFLAGLFAALVVPVSVAEYFLLNNTRLYCPHCGQLLVRPRALCWINKHDECVRCKAKLNVRQATRRECVVNNLFGLGGLAVLTIILTVVC